MCQERFMRLAYELLDAHDDTARLADDFTCDARWQAHLDYLRDLQRVGRETLAQASDRQRVVPAALTMRKLRPRPRRRALRRLA
jgi:hypothetical protein